MLFGYARAVILHAQHSPTFFTGQFDMHPCASAAGIFDAVFDQIHERPAEVLWITGDE